VWQPAQASDLWHYTVYRGDTDGFPLDAAHKLAVPTGTMYDDAGYTPGSYYAVSATDRHGNEGVASRLTPAAIAGVVPGAPPAVSYATIAGANPSAQAAVIEYGVARAGRVALEVYDVGGRKVATLVDGEQPVGVRRVAWAGGGHPGVYLVRYIAPGAARTLRLVRTE